jgi:DNA-directed RNA polymerase specialized sigma24 family protein
MSGLETTSGLPGANATFTPTHWSVVQAARHHPSPGAEVALERLCRLYWRPLYAFIRRRGYELHDAQDLTQEFFARLLEKDFLSGVDRSKGKFRSFLLAALEHFLANEWRRGRAQKRGGKFAFISFDDGFPEQQYFQVPATTLTPEQLFDQQWAVALLSQSLARLQEEFAAAGKEPLFESIKVLLTGEKLTVSYHALAAKLEMTEAALKMAVSRMRRRYGELLRAEIAQTVAGDNEIEEELRLLFGALGS